MDEGLPPISRISYDVQFVDLKGLGEGLDSS